MTEGIYEGVDPHDLDQESAAHMRRQAERSETVAKLERIKGAVVTLPRHRGGFGLFALEDLSGEGIRARETDGPDIYPTISLETVMENNPFLSAQTFDELDAIIDAGPPKGSYFDGGTRDVKEGSLLRKKTVQKPVWVLDRMPSGRPDELGAPKDSMLPDGIKTSVSFERARLDRHEINSTPVIKAGGGLRSIVGILHKEATAPPAQKM